CIGPDSPRSSPLSLHDALPICPAVRRLLRRRDPRARGRWRRRPPRPGTRPVRHAREGGPDMIRAGTRAALAAAVVGALALAGCGGGGGADGADDAGGWRPDGDVTMVVPFAAGGGSDRAGRALAAAIEAADPDISVSVENREGGSGAVGYSYFLGRNGDAETLLATETALLALPTSGQVEF